MGCERAPIAPIADVAVAPLSRPLVPSEFVMLAMQAAGAVGMRLLGRRVRPGGRRGTGQRYLDPEQRSGKCVGLGPRKVEE